MKSLLATLVIFFTCGCATPVHEKEPMPLVAKLSLKRGGNRALVEFENISRKWVVILKWNTPFSGGSDYFKIIKKMALKRLTRGR
jgi:hypothetical protein